MSDSQTTTPAPASKAVSVTSEKRWVLASNNKGKLAEFQRLFDQAHLGIEIIPQGQLNIEDAIEDGLSFVENAIIKARHASRISGLPAVADDSGLCVPTLGNAPGIYSARYAGDGASDQNNNAKLLAALESVPADQRTARFVCCCALFISGVARRTETETHDGDIVFNATGAESNTTPHTEIGTVEGRIAFDTSGPHGFGYDPLFIPNGHNKSFGELGATIKSAISHRAQAFKRLRTYLSAK